jgi:hypothetical protein
MMISGPGQGRKQKGMLPGAVDQIDQGTVAERVPVIEIIFVVSGELFFLHIHLKPVCSHREVLTVIELG